MTGSSPARETTTPDGESCAREPIHIPGSIEPSGVLLVLTEPELSIVQVSANASDLIAKSAETLLGVMLSTVLDEDSLRRLRQGVLTRDLEATPHRLLNIHVAGITVALDATVHRLGGLLYIELEPGTVSESHNAALYEAIGNAAAEFRASDSLEDLCTRATRYLRWLTGFDRVMVYRFLDDDSGSVIAEDHREDLTPYLGLRYPASDIPAQARQLYLRNPIRLKPDVQAGPSAMVPGINPVTNKPLDMSHCILRRMSPVHDEYLRNMGVVASMSLSIVKDQRLWGLIACHHTSAKHVPNSVRTACELVTELLIAAVGSREDQEALAFHAEALDAQRRIETVFQAKGGILRVVAENATELAALFGSHGVAASIGGEIMTGGTTPTEKQVQELISWLNNDQVEPVYATDQLSKEFSPATRYVALASGLLSIRITQHGSDCLLWFRPELTAEVNWAGQPEKALEVTPGGTRLGPRRSFASWKETVTGRSRNWTNLERQFALSFRSLLGEVSLTAQNDVVNRLNTELSRSNIELDAYAHAAGHDLQEPIRTVKAYAQLLKRTSISLEPESAELLDFIAQGADRMHNLVAGLLDYSRLGGPERVMRTPMHLKDALSWALMNLAGTIREQGAEVKSEPLPWVNGDGARLMQVFQNLVSNSIRYRSTQGPQIYISAEVANGFCTVHVRDNGLGFDPTYAEEIFGLFKRLHGREVSGSGVGLATCRKIIEQHGGKMWATSERGKGSVFSFSLPTA